jgi:TRAP-type mannitol/chloroaromatic compound transport system substrate-binding protein
MTTSVNRRRFLASASVGAAAAATIAAPAIAQSMPTFKWRLTSGYPKALDTIYGGAETVAKYVREMTDGRFEIQPFAAGEIVGGLQSVDAVSNGTVEMAHTNAYYNVGKDPAFSPPTSLPFLMSKRAQDAWMLDGGGEKIINDFLGKHNIVAFEGGNTGAQMGGWWRREIRNVEDLRGQKFRIAGLAGRVMQKLGIIPQQLAGGDIYPALERGTIDGAEWVGAYDDEKLGFFRVARFFYYPGWWEGGSVLHTMVNTAKWNELPKSYQAILRGASAYANTEMMAKYDARNPAALKRLIQAGVQLRPFPQDVMEAAFRAAQETYAEINATNVEFKKMHDAAVAFRNDFYLYNQLGDFSFDAFMIRARGRA